jgi:hypothetical protein
VAVVVAAVVVAAVVVAAVVVAVVVVRKPERDVLAAHADGAGLPRRVPSNRHHSPAADPREAAREPGSFSLETRKTAGTVCAQNKQ